MIPVSLMPKAALPVPETIFHPVAVRPSKRSCGKSDRLPVPK